MLEKQIAVLGSTGSIGKQALDVIKRQGQRVVSLAAHSSVERLEAQAREYSPTIVCIYNKDCYADLKARLQDTSIRVVTGMEGLCEAATLQEVDVVLNAVVGMIGLQPTLAAIEAKKDVALANKETLVTGGALVTKAAKENGVQILPIDSEHSAIFQSLQGGHRDELRKVILTASGGPFFGKTKQDLAKVTLEEALQHPNWSMGKKITVDSATLMNKGLELIEAVWLFDIAPQDVEIVVHKESILHSAVEFCDGAVIGQMGIPDMRIPIQYALTYPARVPLPLTPLSLTACQRLTFTQPDEDTFVCLKACKEAVRRGGLYPTLVNGANEQAVALFLEKKISFLEIGQLVLGALDIPLAHQEVTLETILEANQTARETVCKNIALEV